MERLRKSFRRKKYKDSEEIKSNADNVEMTPSLAPTIEETEPEPGTSMHKE